MRDSRSPAGPVSPRPAQCPMDNIPSQTCIPYFTEVLSLQFGSLKGRGPHGRVLLFALLWILNGEILKKFDPREVPKPEDKNEIKSANSVLSACVGLPASCR
ncbi:hypothetical protein TREES_T100003213 [Tupaia chinensis]|uniref:Uncharacterized protein n=1 Tax=Tupaia chinensis TaxID=246437 RepID=L9KAD8_TUPCH|nr:hypothetical protein TREES_T100003213 [Tupaia chinensis]